MTRLDHVRVQVRFRVEELVWDFVRGRPGGYVPFSLWDRVWERLGRVRNLVEDNA